MGKHVNISYEFKLQLKPLDPAVALQLGQASLKQALTSSTGNSAYCFQLKLAVPFFLGSFFFLLWVRGMVLLPVRGQKTFKNQVMV